MSKVFVNKTLAIASRTVRNALKQEFRVAAEKRDLCEAKVVRYEDGKPVNEPRPVGQKE